MDMNQMMQMFMMLNMNNMNNPMINNTNKNMNLTQSLQMMNNFINIMNNKANNPNQNTNLPSIEPEYYSIKNIDPLNDNKLSKTNKNLSLFFNCIYDFNKKIIINGTKIYINYYNLEKIELYLDLRFSVKDLISTIFGLILQGCSEKKIFKRIAKNQTTESIIETPNLCYESDSPYLNTLFLEYNKIALENYSDKTGIEIGLKEGDEIFLKLKKEFYDELKGLNLDNTKIVFKYKKYMVFPSFQDEIISNMFIRFSKFMNIDYKLCKFLYNQEDIKNSKSAIKDSLNLTSFNNYVEIYQCAEVTGGGIASLKFSDVSKEKIKYLNFGKTGTKYRYVDKGLNIFGICKYPKCEANKKEVIYIPKKMVLEDNKYFKYSINDEIKNIVCPICNKIIKPKTIGFYQCEYQIKGEKIENGDIVQYDSKPKETKDDKFEYFDPEENGETDWTELVIYVLPKQKIKYQSN